MIYTTNAVEALHRSLRKFIKTRGSFPNDDAALKLLYFAIENAGMRWRRGAEWTNAMGQFCDQSVWLNGLGRPDGSLGGAEERREADATIEPLRSLVEGRVH
jgi:hypothetical protein